MRMLPSHCVFSGSVCVSRSHLHACPLSGPQMRTNVPSWCDRILWKSYPETHIVCNSYGEKLLDNHILYTVCA